MSEEDSARRNKLIAEMIEFNLKIANIAAAKDLNLRAEDEKSA